MCQTNLAGSILFLLFFSFFSYFLFRHLPCLYSSLRQGVKRRLARISLLLYSLASYFTRACSLNISTQLMLQGVRTQNCLTVNPLRLAPYLSLSRKEIIFMLLYIMVFGCDYFYLNCFLNYDNLNLISSVLCSLVPVKNYDNAELLKDQIIKDNRKKCGIYQ